MKIVRNFMEIGSVGSYIQKSSENLQQEKIKIQKYINDILNNYEGKDANEIVNKFITATDKIDMISKDFEYYGQYMQKLAMHDRDNLDTTKSSLNQINSDFNDKNNLNNNDEIANLKFNLGGYDDTRSNYKV